MKIATFLLCGSLALPMTSCLEESSTGNNTIFRVDPNAPKPERPEGGSRYGFGSEEEQRRNAARTRPAESTPPENPGVTETTPPDLDPTIVSPETPVEDPKPETPAAPVDEPPVAKRVPGKPGMVYSPFAENQEIEVTGYPAGTKVRCPITNKTFRVP